MSVPTRRIAVLVGIQVLLVGGVLASNAYTVITGDPIVLETVPVDPRDLFRGDYHTLSYEISTVSVPAGSDWEGGDRVYVLLQKRATYHEAVSVHHGRPPVGAGQECIRGQVQYVDESSGSARLNIEYGIESFFIPENAGNPPQGKVDARVIVDSFCNGVLDAILVNGEEWVPVRNAGR